MKMSFYDWCIENNRQDLLDIWDYKLNNKLPNEVSCCTNNEYFFKCPQNKHKSTLWKLITLTRRSKVKSTCKWLIYNFEECVNQLANGGLKLPTDSEIQQDDNKRYLIHPIDAISYPMHYLSSLRAIAGEQETL